MANVACFVMGAQHDVAILDEGAANAGAHGNHQAAARVAAATPARLAQRVGMHVVEHASRHAKGRLKLGTQVRATPAGHDLVGIGDVTRSRVNHASAGDADAINLATGRLYDATRRGNGVCQHVCATKLCLGGNLAHVLNDGSRALLERHERRGDLGATNVESHDPCHVVLLLCTPKG